MNTLSRIALVALLSTAFAAAAHAQPRRPAKPRPAAASRAKPENVKPPKTRTLIFGEGDELEGNVLSPDGDTVTSNDPAKHTSLLRLRTSFIPEILKSAEDL